MSGLVCIAGQRMGRRSCGVRIVTGCRPACGVACRRAMPAGGPGRAEDGVHPEKTGDFRTFHVHSRAFSDAARCAHASVSLSL